MIDVEVQGRAPAVFDSIVEQYREVLERVLPKGTQGTLLVLSSSREVQLSFESLDGRAFVMRTFREQGGTWNLTNDLLSLDTRYRTGGVAYALNKLGADSLLQLGGHAMYVTAGLDVGGYKWLRDGFWPVKGKAYLDAIARKSKAEKWIVQEWLSLTEDEAQQRILHPILGAKYKHLFRNAQYDAVLDVSNAASYAAVTGAARATANELIQSLIVKRQQELIAAGNHIALRVNEILAETDELLQAKLRKLLDKGKWDYARLEALREAVYKVRTEGWAKVGAEVNAKAIELSYAEAASLAEDVQALLPVQVNVVTPHRRTMRAIALDRPFHGALLREWVQKLRSDDIRRLHGAIQVGMTAGETTDSLVKRVWGSHSLQYKDGAVEATRTQVRTVVRTAVHHIASAARDQFIQENADLVKQERYVATLDGRTSSVCKAWDGKIFPVGEGPRPPLHFNCRSVRVFHFDDTELLKRAADPVLEREKVAEYARKHSLSGKIHKRDDLPKGHKGKFDAFMLQEKRKLIGRVPAALTYNDWLKQQSVSFQNATLGEQKALLFRKGELSLDKFVDTQGRTLSLQELYKKYPTAFQKAGIDL